MQFHPRKSVSTTFSRNVVEALFNKQVGDLIGSWSGSIAHFVPSGEIVFRKETPFGIILLVLPNYNAFENPEPKPTALWLAPCCCNSGILAENPIAGPDADYEAALQEYNALRRKEELQEENFQALGEFLST